MNIPSQSTESCSPPSFSECSIEANNNFSVNSFGRSPSLRSSESLNSIEENCKNKYNFSLASIKYDNDDEYRRVFCQLFMGGISDEELYFDDTLIIEIMDCLFTYTEQNDLFQKLYDLAASKMFSTDRTIGQCILFSYEFLSYFHPCLCTFADTPEQFTENCKAYKDLMEKLT
jgi:hypothetical protein